MTGWEGELEGCAARLSDMENKKLQLMKNRLWRRIAGALSRA